MAYTTICNHFRPKAYLLSRSLLSSSRMESSSWWRIERQEHMLKAVNLWFISTRNLISVKGAKNAFLKKGSISFWTRRRIWVGRVWREIWRRIRISQSQSRRTSPFFTKIYGNPALLILNKTVQSKIPNIILSFSAVLSIRMALNYPPTYGFSKASAGFLNLSLSFCSMWAQNPRKMQSSILWEGYKKKMLEELQDWWPLIYRWIPKSQISNLRKKVDFCSALETAFSQSKEHSNMNI